MKRKKQFNIFIILFFLFFAFPVSSAQLYFEEEPKEANSNQIILNLKLDTQGSDINAIQGRVVFSEDILELKNINEGNSIINFWIEKPLFSSNSVVFSGIVPNGFKGTISPISGENKPGEILKLTFDIKKEGEALIDLQNVKVLKNDGEGTEIPITILNHSLNVSLLVNEENIFNEKEKKDTTPPENFNIEISQDPNIFNNEYFIIFETKDKESGIFFYQIKEGKSDFVVSESPYLLQDQSLSESIIVQAVDKSGNIREEILKSNKINYLDLAWLSILFVLVILSFCVKIKKRC